MHNKKCSFVVVALFAAVALTACGGGGGTSTASTAAPAPAPTPVPAPAPAPAPAPVNPDLVTSVTPATYAAGTVEKGAWDVLMAERAACGFGLLQQDSRLDVASHAHAKYLADLSISTGTFVVGHYEDATKPGFTGVYAWDRAIAQGWPNNQVGENVFAQQAFHASTSGDQIPMSEAQGATSQRWLLTTVYHLAGSMLDTRSGGVGSDHASGPYAATAGYTLEDYRFGELFAFSASVNNPQKLGTGVVATYPCASATHASASWVPANEQPNPFPDVTGTSVAYGTPVFLKVDAGSVLMVTSAVITRQSDGVPIATRQVTKANDPVGEVGANEFFVVPTAALTAGTTYSVTVAGTVDGAAFTKIFTFTPAA